MTGEEFVKICKEEQRMVLEEYFDDKSKSEVGDIIKKLVQTGVSKDDLSNLVDTVLKESYYTLLLGLDGACSLGNKQVTYKLYDEEGNLLNECGEIEESAYSYFMNTI